MEQHIPFLGVRVQVELWREIGFILEAKKRQKVAEGHFLSFASNLSKKRQKKANQKGSNGWLETCPRIPQGGERMVSFREGALWKGFFSIAFFAPVDILLTVFECNGILKEYGKRKQFTKKRKKEAKKGKIIGGKLVYQITKSRIKTCFL